VVYVTALYILIANSNFKAGAPLTEADSSQYGKCVELCQYTLLSQTAG